MFNMAVHNKLLICFIVCAAVCAQATEGQPEEITHRQAVVIRSLRLRLRSLRQENAYIKKELMTDVTKLIAKVTDELMTEVKDEIAGTLSIYANQMKTDVATEVKRQVTGALSHELEVGLEENFNSRVAGYINATINDKVQALGNKCEKKLTKMHTTEASRAEVGGQFTALGCVSDVVTLSCPDDQFIYVTSAYYGKYSTECTGCCAPNPRADCTEHMENNTASDWLALKVACDEQTTCSLEYKGSVVNECEEGYVGDYAQVFYNCLPVRNDQPVGFTAWANTGNGTEYISEEVVIFDEIISNFGGHYNPQTSSFQCPFDGVYLFNVQIQAEGSYSFSVDLFRNNVWLTRAWADDFNAVSNQASLTTLTECNWGETVWVQGYTGAMHGVNRVNTFTGSLLHRY